MDSSRREKIAAQRAAARRAEKRRRILLASGSVLVVIAVVLTFVIIKLNSKSPAATASGASNGPTGAALTSVVDKTTSVSPSTLDTVGAGTFANKIQTISGNPALLKSGGKPEMLYIGAEYCPYCGVTRWAMIVALSRFGTFSGLHTVHSSSTDVYANTPTFSFYKSAYTSKYLNFTSVELTTNVADASSSSGYVPLQTPTAAQAAIENKYDVAPYTSENGSIPFVDFGNKYLMIGTPFLPSVLDGMSWSTIASDLNNPNSAAAKAVDGTANYFTAAICKMTGNQPASACTPAVQSLESKL